MKCTLVRGLCLFCSFLIVAVSIVLFSQVSFCPAKTFRCAKSGICLPRSFWCNGHADCGDDDDSDEDTMGCLDYHGELDSLSQIIDKVATVTPRHNVCEIELADSRCVCSNGNRMICENLNLTAVPHVGGPLSRIILPGNWIRRLSADDLTAYDLQSINLHNNILADIDPHALRGQANLKILYLARNRLKYLHWQTFQTLSTLEWLFIGENQLQDIGVFYNLPSLQWLDLSRNDVRIEAGQHFAELPSLKDLLLNDNQIEDISDQTFAYLHKLSLLDLKRNKIRTIHQDALVNLVDLRLLDLSDNNLQFIPGNLFRSQANLIKLQLGFNPIVNLAPDLFLPMISLVSLGLHEVDIANINVRMFSSATNLSFVYFKMFRYCSYTPHADKCQPLSDGVSSMNDLISSGIHRACLWIICILNIVGNVMVLCGRGLAKTENRILSNFVKNLAAADMCIGFYLICIGERDVAFRNQYKLHARQWMDSWQCTALRLVAVTTSEVSLLLLAFMSVERYWCISHPFGERKLTFRVALASVSCIWLLGFCLALIPVVYWRGGQHYGSNGLCFPLHMNEPRAIGWNYSAFLYIGINGLCVVMIVYVYTALFLSIRRTRHATPLAPNEIEIAVRFFFIVFTDCVCWVPTIVLKILAFFQVIDIPADLYAWLVVFILPINSTINPFLYTFTTPVFRATIRDFFRRTISYANVTNSFTLPGRSLRDSSSVRNDYHNNISNRCTNTPADDGGRIISMIALQGSSRLDPEDNKVDSCV